MSYAVAWPTTKALFERVGFADGARCDDVPALIRQI
jgi:hypothetical protein